MQISNLPSLLLPLQDMYTFLERQKANSHQKNSICAPEFNPLDFLKNNEKDLSAILAFILNTYSSHGQKSLFLDSFLRHFKLFSFLSYDNVSVELEKHTKHFGRYHDILITAYLYEKVAWVISIENKIYGALHQKNQLNDYLSDLKNYQTNLCLILLSSEKDHPPKYSIDRNKWNNAIQRGEALNITTAELYEWLNEIITPSPPINQFIYYLKRYVKERIMLEKRENNLFIQNIIENPPYLHAALNIIEQQDSLYKILLGKLTNQLERKCHHTFPILFSHKWYGEQWGVIGKKNVGISYCSPDDKMGVGLAFGKGNFQFCYYGAWAAEEEAELSQKLRTIQQQHNAKQGDWIYWKHFPANHLLHWEFNEWEKIYDGRLASEIFEYWYPLLETLSNHIIEIEKKNG